MAINVTESTFEKLVLQSETPVLVDFWAGWCAPCRALAPVLDRVGLKLEDQLEVVKVDADANPQLVAEYGVRGLPTLILFREGKEVWRLSGAQGEAQLLDALAPLLA